MPLESPVLPLLLLEPSLVATSSQVLCKSLGTHLHHSNESKYNILCCKILKFKGTKLKEIHPSIYEQSRQWE